MADDEDTQDPTGEFPPGLEGLSTEIERLASAQHREDIEEQVERIAGQAAPFVNEARLCQSLLSELGLVRVPAPQQPCERSAAGGTWAGLRPSAGGLVHEGDGVARARIQRCGIGSSCDCPARSKMAGIERDLQRATAVGGTPLPAAHRERIESPGAPPIVHEVLGSPGEPLADSHQASFEAQLGADLHEVRVHTNPQADVSARAVGALAYTVGRHLVFRRGA